MKIKRIRYHRKKIFIFLFLFLFLVGIGVGFAFVTTKLDIEGIVHVKDAKWDIHFDNYQEITGSVTPTTTPTISGTSISFSAKINDPGDFYGFTIDVENEGTIDADILDFICFPALSTVDYIDTVVEYDDGTPIQNGDVLVAGDTKTIKVLLTYKDGISEDLYPTTDQSYDLILSLDYEQHVDSE